MAHDHTSAETCIYCSLKHAGAAKVKIGEAIASADPERRKTRLLDAMAELNEIESTHLGGEYPDAAKHVREVRKRIEETAFGFNDRKVSQADIDPIIAELIVLEKKDHDKSKPAKEEDYVPDEAFAKVLAATPGNVLKAIDHYKGDYGAAASLSDVQFLLTIPHASKLDKQIDRAFSKVPMPEIEKAVKDLERQGLIEEAPGGGYLPTGEGRERLGFPEGSYIPKAHNELKMLKGSDVGLIVGSSLAAKGTSILANWVDTQYGLSTQPLHMRATTYVPLVGAAAIFASRYVKAIKRKDERALAVAVFGANLLAQGVDVVQQATTPGVTFGLVQVPRAVVQPGLTSAPTPGYISQLSSGVGGLRTIF